MHILDKIMYKRIIYRVIALPTVAFLSYQYTVNWLLWVCAFFALGYFIISVATYSGLKKKKSVYLVWLMFLTPAVFGVVYVSAWGTGLALGMAVGSAIVSLYWAIQLNKWAFKRDTVQETVEPMTMEQVKEAYKFDTSAISTNRANMTFTKAEQPITEAITKFGGQPVWIDTPQWPLGKMSGKPMRFIGQIKLDEKLFGKKQAQMAYIFYSEGIDDNTDTFEIEGGENAVILQPGTPLVPVVEQATGLTIEDIHNEKTKCEFKVNMTYSEDPEFIPEYEAWELPPAENEKYYNALGGNKIGGVPGFIQADEFPDNSPWQLLMQMDDESLHEDCYLNFGVGIAYAMINPEGTKARFFWQC